MYRCESSEHGKMLFVNSYLLFLLCFYLILAYCLQYLFQSFPFVSAFNLFQFVNDWFPLVNLYYFEIIVITTSRCVRTMQGHLLIVTYRVSPTDLYNITGLLGLSKKWLKNDGVSRGYFSHCCDRWPLYISTVGWLTRVKTKKTHNLLQVVNRRETALFRADEPTGVNNAVLTVHIKHDSNRVLYCVNSTYHAWYQYFSYHVEYIIYFSFTVYVIISCIIARQKNTQYILQKIYYWRQMIIH